MIKHLNVYLNEVLAGRLQDVGNARIEFQYNADYLNNHSPALSVALPITRAHYDDQAARAFFSGLLPDDQELDSLARY